jgi:hypothetical protein
MNTNQFSLAEPDRPSNESNIYDIKYNSGIRRNRIVVLVEQPVSTRNKGLFADLKLDQLCHYIYEECFEPIRAEVKHAFEIIRWEQPCLVIIDSTFWSTAHSKLIARLKADGLTSDIALMLWVNPSPASVMLEKAVKKQPDQQEVVVNDKFARLQTVLQSYNHHLIRPIKPGKAIATVDSSPASDTLELRNLLTNLELKNFVERVIPNWATLQLAMLLAEKPALAFNREILWYLLDLEEWVAEIAIDSLARAGYIEPLEYDTTEPLWGLVAFSGKVGEFERFANAIKTPQYRLALATMLLSASE